MQVSNIIVISYFSFFGDAFLGGYTVYNKIDHLLFLTANSLGVATTTFVGQNIGAGNYERAKRGPAYSLKIGLAISAVLIAVLELFAPQITGFFNPSPEIIAFGSTLIRVNIPFFFLSAFSHIYAGLLQGTGDTKTPTIIGVSSYVVIRQLYLFFMTRYVANTTIIVGLCFPVGWAVHGIITFIVAKMRAKKLPSGNAYDAAMLHL